MMNSQEFRLEDLATDPDLRAYALDDLKLGNYDGNCVHRHTVGVLNLCQHLHHLNLPKTNRWALKDGPRDRLKSLDSSEVYADVEELLDPVHLVCNYALPKRITWRIVVSILLALKHATGHAEINNESYENYPYERAAKQHVQASIDKERCDSSRVITRAKNQVAAFQNTWTTIPLAVSAIIRILQDAMDSGDPPDMTEVETHILCLPLPPGVPTKEEKEKQERVVMQRDLEEEDDWYTAPKTPEHQEKKRLTEAIWEQRKRCKHCSGSGLSSPSVTCAVCGGTGVVS